MAMPLDFSFNNCKKRQKGQKHSFIWPRTTDSDQTAANQGQWLETRLLKATLRQAALSTSDEEVWDYCGVFDIVFFYLHLYLKLIINILNIQCCRSQMSGLLEEDGVGFFLFLLFIIIIILIIITFS